MKYLLGSEMKCIFKMDGATINSPFFFFLNKLFGEVGCDLKYFNVNEWHLVSDLTCRAFFLGGGGLFRE